jgi:serine phosphatase RsbU (regulator of sigma subunit)
MERGDMLYLFTDGYADQFGGNKQKKLKYARLEEIILAVCRRDVSDQKSTLENEFKAWKGHLEQVDDVCVIGVCLG